jgi:two-component system chemotaxis response regulator CheY
MIALVVEDSPSMRNIVASMLRKMGYGEVLTAEHGGEALRILQTHPVDLILTDWNMPVISGLDLLRQVRSTPSLEEVPVVMFTARNARADVVEAVRACVDGYLTKPFSPQELRRKLRSLSNRRSAIQIRRLLAGQDPMDRNAAHPLVIFGEGAVSEEHLSRPDNLAVVTYLSYAIDALGLVSSREEDLHIAGVEAEVVTLVGAGRIVRPHPIGV